MYFESKKNERHLIDFGVPDMYKFYIKNYKRKFKPLDAKTYNLILKAFNKKLCHEIIYNAFEFKLPARLGTIRGNMYKPRIKKDMSNFNKVYPVDFKKTTDLWKEMYPGKTPKEILEISDRPVIRHQNKETDGYKCKWYWNKKTCRVRNKTFYSLIMTRTNKRNMAQAFKDPEQNVKYFMDKDPKLRANKDY